MSTGPPLCADLWNGLPPEAQAVILALRTEVDALQGKIHELRRKLMQRKILWSALAALPFVVAAASFGLYHPANAATPPNTPANALDCCLDPTCPPGCSEECPPNCPGVSEIRP